MKTIGVSKARSELSGLVEHVRRGRGSVVLTRYGKRVADIVVHRERSLKRPVYSLRGLPITVPTNFDASTPKLWRTQLPGEFHRDPSDRIIIALARRHGVPLVTADRLMRKYPHVQGVWWAAASGRGHFTCNSRPRPEVAAHHAEEFCLQRRKVAGRRRAVAGGLGLSWTWGWPVWCAFR